MNSAPSSGMIGAILAASTALQSPGAASSQIITVGPWEVSEASPTVDVERMRAQKIVPRKPTVGYSGPLTPCGRNDPCPCKSGKKFKKCCRRTS